MRGLALIHLVALAVTLTVGRPARGDDVESFRVVYAATAPSCPTEESFLTRLKERSPRARQAAPGEMARTFDVRIVATAGDRVVGTLAVRSANGGATDERTFGSDRCDEVVSVLALAASLTFADDGTMPPRAVEPIDVGPLRPATPADGLTASVAPSSARTRWRIAIGASGSVEQGLSPGVLPALGVFAELRAPWRERSAVRLGVMRAVDTSVALEAGSARFGWTAGVADLCPYAWQGGLFVLSPCWRVEAGVLEGQGEHIEPARLQTRTWLATGGLGRLRITPTAALFAELEGGVRMPLLRDRFYVQPDETIFRAPAFAWQAAANVGVTIP